MKTLRHDRQDNGYDQRKQDQGDIALHMEKPFVGDADHNDQR